MSNEERFMDVLFEEAVQNRAAPDLVARTLTRAEKRAHSPVVAEVEAPVIDIAERLAARRWRWLRLAAAACVLLVAGLISWMVLAPRTIPPSTTHTVTLSGFGLGTDGRFTMEGDKVRLLDGWFVLTMGAPVVIADGALIEQVRGFAMVRVGEIPTEEEFIAEAQQHKFQTTETNVDYYKRWVKRGGIALVVLVGSVMVNGEIIRAEEVKTPEIAVEKPAVVRTISDIQALGPDTTWVKGENLSDGHIEFLSRLPKLRILDLSGCGKCTVRGLEFLGDCKELQQLDLQACGALEQKATMYTLSDADKFKALKDLTVDARLIIGTSRMSEALTAWMKELGSISVVAGAQFKGDEDINELVNAFPNLKALELNSNTLISDLAFKSLANATKLERLSVASCAQLSDAAFAYLSERTSITDLDISGIFNELGRKDQSTALKSALGQIAKLPKLQRLTMHVTTLGDDALEQLSACKSLTALDCVNCRVVDTKQLSPLAKVKGLRELNLNGVREAGNHNAPYVCENFAFLAPLKELRRLDLGNMLLTNAQIASLPVLPALERLGLQRAAVMTADNRVDSMSDECVKHIAEFSTLVELDLMGFQSLTATSNLIELKALTRLKSLDLRQKQGNRERDDKLEEALKKALPDCKILIKDN